MAQYANDIHGHVLEIADNSYTLTFGGNRVSKSDILHVTADNPKATIIADLTNAKQIISETFDCIILTQSLQFIYDVNAALQTVYRILKPNGVLLATFPGISKISRYDMQQWGEYWRFTSLSAYRLFTEEFHKNNVIIKSYGNVLTAIASLEGLITEELRIAELDYCDPDYEVLITVRAQKKPK